MTTIKISPAYPPTGFKNFVLMCRKNIFPNWNIILKPSNQPLQRKLIASLGYLSNALVANWTIDHLQVIQINTNYKTEVLLVVALYLIILYPDYTTSCPPCTEVWKLTMLSTVPSIDPKWLLKVWVPSLKFITNKTYTECTWGSTTLLVKLTWPIQTDHHVVIIGVCS